ncbi:maleylacetoacetate isomerase [uncultured Tateyamaria sp.]|uniref:maleylacetoacetate isomerase n=1 Tax=uncultured Tateyamaria sp. TaxID=455651 RepID=UPI00261490DB|nr:maleylacetoacetate isomerase [uncultured Tateyamaria sp.]
MNLFNFPRSSASYRVRIACALKGLDPTIVPVNFREDAQRSSAFLRVNASGLVPALETDDGKSLTQSLVIIGYLDQIAPEPRLFPENPERALRANEIALAIACDIHPLNNLRVLTYLRETFSADDDAIDTWIGNWVQLGFQGVETLVARQRGQYCLGDHVTIADCCLVPQMYNARRFGVDLTAFPNLVEIDASLNAIPEIAGASPEAL